MTITLSDGTTIVKEKRDYKGFHTNPMGWEQVRAKFESLSAPQANAKLRRDIADAVANLEAIGVRELAELLALVGLANA